jgi:hypothetical protein
MDVAGWLRGLGLGQYETSFRDHKINADLLPRLTNDDLKDIGVSALGDRLQLLDAIAALAGPKPPVDVPAFRSEPSPITVMFCDLVGSTSLASKLDAEDWRKPDHRRGRLIEVSVDQVIGGHVAETTWRRPDGPLRLSASPRERRLSARGRRWRPSARLSKSTRGTRQRASRNYRRASALSRGRSSWRPGYSRSQRTVGGGEGPRRGDPRHRPPSN